MKKSHYSYEYCIFSLPSSPFHSPLLIFQKKWKMCYCVKLFLKNCIHLKIHEITFVSFCMFLLEYFYVFECFYCCLSRLIWFFVKIFTHFYEQIKHKTGDRFHSTGNNKLMESLQTQTNLKDCSVFGKSKFLSGLAIREQSCYKRAHWL